MKEIMEDKADKALGELREEIRRAHEVIKDLRACLKEAREYVNGAARELVTREITRELEPLPVQTRKAIDGAELAINARFDRLCAILMGEEDGGPTLADIAMAYRTAQINQEKEK